MVVGQGITFAWQKPFCCCMSSGQESLYRQNATESQLRTYLNITLAGLRGRHSFTTLEYEMCCFSGVFVRIKGEPMHPECFKCVKCGKNLKNQGLFFSVSRIVLMTCLSP